VSYNTLEMPGGTALNIRVELPNRLIFWMHRAATRVKKARHSLSPKTVHEMRTSLRRCLSLLKILHTDDAREIISAARSLFKDCAILRDLQVMRDEVTRLPMDRKTRRKILARFTLREKVARVKAMNAVRNFNQIQWQVLMHAAGVWKISPQDMAYFKQVALKRLEKVRKRYQTCSFQKVSAKDLHRLRISIKKFRYTIENCFSQLYEKYGRPLKKFQDALGRHQDLIVLEKELARMGCLTPTLQKPLGNERNSLRHVLLQLTTACNRTGMWERWQKNLERI
jgi:CHAD domain-containing protein